MWAVIGMCMRASEMKRKYLDDIGVTDRPDLWNKDDKRQEEWAEERETYGFDERESWNLDLSFRLWLYERLKYFLEVAPISLDYHIFEYQGEDYTQEQLINMILERLEFSFKPSYNDLDYKQLDYVNEAAHMWALVMPAMWW